jgi:uncharacterized protein YggT (Ycf19 family)
MAALYWIAKVYKYYLIGWVLASWIPGLNQSELYAILGIPVWPVLAPFDFLHLGPVGFGAIIPLILLNMLENWAGKQAGILTEDGDELQGQSQAAVVDVRDLKPVETTASTNDPADGYSGRNVGI